MFAHSFLTLSFPVEDIEASGASDGGEIKAAASSPSTFSVCALTSEQEPLPPCVAPPKFSLQISEGIYINTVTLHLNKFISHKCA